MDGPRLTQLLEGLAPDKVTVLKLLHVEDYEFTAGEVGRLADISGRSVPEMLGALERLRSIVRDRESSMKEIEDALDGVQAWIQLFERRIQCISTDLAAMASASSAAARLQDERTDLQRKVERRHAQRRKLLVRMQRRKVTAPYKEIAAVLNTSVGNVGSQIARLRDELQDKLRSGDR